MVSENNQYWTLGEAIAWVLKGDEKIVLSIPEKRRARVKEALVSIVVEDGNAFFLQDNDEVQSAIQSIKKHCCDEALRSYGQKNIQSTFEKIPSLDWLSSNIKSKNTDSLFVEETCLWINIRFSKEDLVVLFKGKRKGRRGNKPYNDTEYFKKMRSLLQSGEAKSINDAALQVARSEDAKGLDIDTLRERLRKKYPKWLSESD